MARRTNNNSNGSKLNRRQATVVDPVVLLARGYTARYLGANLQGIIQPLSSEEMDRDLRHLTAYDGACQRYHQAFYQALNGISPAEANANSSTVVEHAAVPLSPSSLPVRIDPDEEKRLASARKRVARAEAVRDELEQQYVSLRAHYVRTIQKDVKEAEASRAIAIAHLQEQVQRMGKIVALQRCRLQMARDALKALTLRQEALEKAGPGGTATEGQLTSNNDDCPMTQVWTAVEEELKSLVTNSKSGRKQDKIVEWRGRTVPATPPGIALLLSALSTVPEKSVAWHGSGMFGSSKDSLVWLGENLPSIDETEQVETEIEEMQREVDLLKRQLKEEMAENQSIVAATAQARFKNDQWVAMMSLLRQETEAVLHRHNIILESDVGLRASDRLFEEHVHKEGGEDAVLGAPNADDHDAKGSMDATDANVLLRKQQPLADEANDGDDEGSNEEEDEGGDWNATVGKRAANDEESSSPSNRKRRRL